MTSLSKIRERFKNAPDILGHLDNLVAVYSKIDPSTGLPLQALIKGIKGATGIIAGLSGEQSLDLDIEQRFQSLFVTICHRAYLSAMHDQLAEILPKITKAAKPFPDMEEAEAVWGLEFKEPVDAADPLFDLYDKHLVIILADQDDPTALTQRVHEKATRLFNLTVTDPAQGSEWICNYINAEQMRRLLTRVDKLSPQRPTGRAPTELKVRLEHLPTTDPKLFGREADLLAIEAAWQDPKKTILTLIAWGGVGKTALTNTWINHKREQDWDGVKRIFGWSFYSQGMGADRQASGDQFLNEALLWFGHTPAGEDPHTMGVRLAELVQAHSCLIVLDGVEPLQYAPGGPVGGQLRDTGVKSFLRNLALGSGKGLCLLSSRVALADLKSYEGHAVVRHALGPLDEAAGVDLLRHLEVKGRDDELAAAVRENGGHALALRLMASYLVHVHEGNCYCRDRIPELITEPIQGGHAKKILAAYEVWLRGQPAWSLLHLLGLFDRPVQIEVLRELLAAGEIAGLTDGLTVVSLGYAVGALRDLGLVSQDEFPQGFVDCHPLVREFFGERLQGDMVDAAREAHGRLYEYYKGVPKDEFPETLAAMEPLLRAVYHGCRAGREQEALDEVYSPRIRRKHKHFINRKLGAYGANLTVLAGFFALPWSTPAAGLRETAQAAVLNWAGIALRALGRLREAISPIEAGCRLNLSLEDWKNAANAASTVCQLRLTLGDLTEALSWGKQALAFADRSGDLFHRIVGRTDLAEAQHGAGDLDGAARLFAEAEALQKERQPKFPLLYSLQGYSYNDLLLDLGRHGEVLERVGQTLEWAKKYLGLLDEALDYLALARAEHLAWRERGGDDATMAAAMDQALEALRRANTLHHFSRGLIARAAFLRDVGDDAGADRDLAEALEIAERGEMRFYLIPIYQALGRNAEAQHLIEQTGLKRWQKDAKRVP